MKVMRKEFVLGLGCLALYFLLKNLTNTPILLLGIIAGCGLVLEIIGVLPEKAYLALKGLKKNLFSRK